MKSDKSVRINGIPRHIECITMCERDIPGELLNVAGVGKSRGCSKKMIQKEKPLEYHACTFPEKKSFLFMKAIKKKEKTQIDIKSPRPPPRSKMK